MEIERWTLKKISSFDDQYDLSAVVEIYGIESRLEENNG